MSEVDRLYYVYAHRRATDGQPFYIGKGKNRRAWSASGRNRRWHHIVAKHGFTAVVVRGDLPELCALTLERIVIAANKHLGLANYVDGGGGTAGWKHSEETKRRIGAHWKGRKFTPRMREALDAYNRGKKLSDSHKAKLSVAKKGKKRRPHSVETRAKIAASHMGIRPSAETLRKMSVAKIGKAVGRDSPTYDHTIRHWRNDDGREFVGTRGDFIKQFGLMDSCVSATISGKQKSVKGWRLK